MKFQLTIDLGNDRALSSTDIAYALRIVADRLIHNEYVERFIDTSEDALVRGVSDINGNTIGSWQLIADEKEE